MYGTETETRERDYDEGLPDRERFGPPAEAQRVSVLAAAGHYPWLVVIPIVLLVAAGVFLGLHRKPNYTAQVRLQVAAVDPNQPGAATGFATATAALASSYSRIVGANGVIDPVAHRYHVAPKTVGQRVTATPIPDSPLFSVSATDKSARSAMTLANAVADSLTSYIQVINRQDPSSSLLYQRYRVASKSAMRARVIQGKIRSRYNADHSDANAAALEDATANVETQQLRANTLAQQYQSTRQIEAVSAPPRVVTRPRAASSDRKSRLELAVFLGLVGGLIIGLALATVRE